MLIGSMGIISDSTNESQILDRLPIFFYLIYTLHIASDLNQRTVTTSA